MRSAIHYQPIFIANLYRKVFLALTKPDKTQPTRQSACSLLIDRRIHRYELNVKLSRDPARLRKRVLRQAQGGIPRHLTVWRSRTRRDNVVRQ
jgi:hypothetical protein